MMIEIKTPLPFAEADSNVPLLRFTHEDITIEGYSRAAVQTYWRIPQFKLGFDHGNHPHRFAAINHMAFSHGHADHISGAFSYLTTRLMLHLPPPKLYLPAECVAPFEAVLAGWRGLSTDELPCEILPCRPGDVFDIEGHRMLKVLATRHSAPSCGYLVYERVRKLKPELSHLSSDEVSELSRRGVEITDHSSRPLLAYLGDTTIEAFELNPELLDVPILITEITFPIAEELEERAIEVGHTHLNEFIKVAPQLNNQLIVVGHFSIRYSREAITQSLATHLPQSLNHRVVAWV
jgi:ribonuclease Z